MIRKECGGIRLHLNFVIAIGINILSFCAYSATAVEAKDGAIKPTPGPIDNEPNYKKLWGEQYKKGIHSLEWDPSKGWNGLVPGKSSIAQVIKKLGPPNATERDVIGWNHYGFASCITVMFFGTNPIDSIEVFPSEKYLANYPLTVHDAKIMYGPIKRRLKMEGDVTEPYFGRPGLTMIVASDKDDAQVNYMRFEAPEGASDKKSK